MKPFTKDEIAQLRYAPLWEWWDEGNTNGDGFPVGEEDDLSHYPPLHRIAGLKFQFHIDLDGVVSVERESGDILVIRDTDRPQAVRVSKKARAWLNNLYGLSIGQ